MPSFVELVFTAVGTEATAHAVESLNEKLADEVRELGHLATASLSAEAAIESFKGVIEEGVMFKHLSARTGESVRDLVILDQAFKNAGLSGQAVGSMANLLQKSLGGLNEMGASTASAFKRVGTSLEALRPLAFKDQLDVLSRGFAGIENPAERANIAMQIFGRSGGEMLQLLGDSDSIEKATEDAGELADRLQADVPKFHAAENQLDAIKSQFHMMAVVGAEQLLPVLKNIAEVLKLIPFDAIGAFAGTVGPTILAVGIGNAVVKKLDSAVYGWAIMKGEPIGQAFAGKFLAPITEGLTKVFSVIGAFAIGYSIGKGLVKFLEEVGNKHAQDRQNKINDRVAPALDNQKTITSVEEAVRQKAEIDKTLAGLNAQQKRWEYEATHASFRGAGIQKHTEELEDLKQEKALLLSASKGLGDPEYVGRLISENLVRTFHESMGPLVANMAAMLDQKEKNALDAASPSDRAIILAKKRSELENDYSSPAPAGAAQSDVDAKRLDIALKLDAIKKAQKENDSKILEETKRLNEEEQKRLIYALETQMTQAKAAGNDALAQRFKEEIDLKRALFELSGKDLDLAKARAAAEHQIWEQEQARVAARKQIDATKLTIENTLDGIRENMAKLEEDSMQTDNEKWAQRKKFLGEEITALEAAIKLERQRAMFARMRGGAGEGVAQQHEAAADSMGKDLQGAQHESRALGADPNSMSDQLSAASMRVKNQMQTIAQSIGSTWENMASGMRSSMSGAIYDMLARTKNLGQAAGAVWSGIKQSIGHSISEAASDYILKHVIMNNAHRLFLAMGLVQEKAATAAGVVVHANGEGAKTGATLAGALQRGASRVGETILHGIQVVIRTTLHIAGEAAQTAATILQSGMRMAANITESLSSIIKAAAGAMSAMASIPYVGPILAVAAAAAMIAEGSSLIKGARETGGPVEKGAAYLVGEKRPEIFVPDSDGYILPDASNFSMTAPAVPHSSPRNLQSSAAPSSARSNALGGARARESARNHYWYVDRKAWLRDSRSDIAGIAGEVFEQKARKL